ncbi:MAG TPA: VIT1/CCC1 transporter family protein, partial [Gammaproteobacteria bacterium]|nr:VIT1/CCC1 transporter family protein [Gammaproteobacteria bacterium]
KALQTLAREELGLNPEDLGSPSGAAIASFISFAFGAVIPLLPFCAGNSPMHLFCSLTLTGCSLFFIGIMLSLFTNRNAIMSGLRMLAVGAIAGSLTYLIGKIIGVSFT